jgi:hypothetical protein
MKFMKKNKMAPGQFIEFHKAIRTPEDATAPEYKSGFILRELSQAKSFAARKRSNAKTQSKRSTGVERARASKRAGPHTRNNC